ncbi:MAG: GNAT family N-acetyltransferase [Ferruginibacter sp.]
MIEADFADKDRVVDILANSFNDNKSVNYIIQQDSKRIQRIKRLMEYSFEVCLSFGKVYMSDDKNACALLLLPDKKKTTLRSIWNDVKLMCIGIGIANLQKVLSREKKIRALQPKQLIYYLWFIGVTPEGQGKGIGSQLLKDVLADCSINERIICLETSTIKNIPWYEKLGFKVYNQLDLGYQLFFLKKE